MHEEIENALEPFAVIRYAEGKFTQEQTFVCREENRIIKLSGDPLVRMLCTGTQLRELAAGFVISAGLTRTVTDVIIEDDGSINVLADVEDEILQAAMELDGCMQELQVNSALTISPEEIFTIIDAIESELWRATGGAHCSVLFSGGEMIAKSSDIGRHNTLDKVIGHTVLNRIDAGACIVGCTGRQPAGMVAKAARAGIPIIVSKAATTKEGIEFAQRAGITLICRVKNNGFTVCSHPQRVSGGQA